MLKAHRLGTHRAVAPDATLARVLPLLPAMGITRVANVTGLDSVGLPVVMVCRPNARSLAVDQGKGLDLVAAKVSGIMEAVERYHGENIALPTVFASYEALRQTRSVADAGMLPHRNDSRFMPDQPLSWVAGVDLRTEEEIWLPLELVSLDYTLPEPPGSGCFTRTRTGVAAGNILIEAINHATCEVIERDAMTLWHVLDDQERAQTRLDLDSVDDVSCRAALAALAHAEIDVAVWDLTSDVGVAAFLCALLPADGPEGPQRRLEAGSGCHPARAIALLRAVTEAAQTRLTRISGSRDDLAPESYRPAAPDSGERWAWVVQQQGRRAFADVPDWDSDSLEADAQWLMHQLQRAGFGQVIAFDLTRPEFGIPVVRVVIPGLEDGIETPHYLPGARVRQALAQRHQRAEAAPHRRGDS